MPLASSVTRAHCWLRLHLLSTRTPRAFLCKAAFQQLSSNQRLLMPVFAPPLVQHLALTFAKGQERKSKTSYSSFQDWFKQPVSQLSYFILSLFPIFFHIFPSSTKSSCNISTSIQSYKLHRDHICLATTYISRPCQACSSRRTHLQAKGNTFKWSLKLLLDKQHCSCTMSQMWLISTRG